MDFSFIKNRASIFIAILLVLCMLLPIAASAETINEARAKSIAHAHAGVNSANVIVEDILRKQDDGLEIYNYEFTSPQYFNFEYDIDANTGRILDYKCDWDDAEGKPAGLTESYNISEQDAIALAMKHAGVEAGDMTVKRVKKTIDNGVSIYAIEFYNKYVEYEYLVSGSSGALLEYECEWQSYSRLPNH